MVGYHLQLQVAPMAEMLYISSPDWYVPSSSLLVLLVRSAQLVMQLRDFRIVPATIQIYTRWKEVTVAGLW
jgi:hypothetical protein